MKIISYITHRNIASRNLEKSLIKYGYDYQFIGIGQKWIGFVNGKIKGLRDYLQTAIDDIYCVIDGYDILATSGPAILLEKYSKFNSPIVFGGEKFCFSYNGTPIEKYRNISVWQNRKYLNGGFCIGPRDDLLELYSWVINRAKNTGINDDQKIFGEYTNIFPKKIEVDISQKILFNTITSVDSTNFTVIGGKIIINSFQTYPCFIHFPSINSDGYERYCNFGRAILGKKFFPIYGEKSWNFFANIRLYCFLLFLTFCVSFHMWKYKGLVVLLILYIVIAKMYIQL